MQGHKEGFLFERRPELNPEDLKQAGPDKRYTTKALLSALPKKGLSGEAWFAAVKELAGMSQKTFEKLRTELHRQGMIHFSKISNLWKKTSRCMTMEENQDDSGDEEDDSDE
jgi:hypothetical protein